MRVTATELRANIFRLLDRVLETGEPLEIERNGRVLRVVPAAEGSWLDRLPRRDGFLRDPPEDYVHLDWSEEWRP